MHPRDNQHIRRVANLGRTQVPAVPDPTARPRTPKHLDVFGAGPDWVQLTWSGLGPGPIRFCAGDAEVTVAADGGPGATTITGLPADRSLTIGVSGPGVPVGFVRRVRTLRPPPGERLHRLATLNDVHIGQESTGYFHTMIEIPRPIDLHPVRCARAALAEARSTGIDQLLIKGDLTHASTPANWEDVGTILDDVEVPVDIVPGNHEGSSKSTIAAHHGLSAHGRHLIRGVEVMDRPGVRVVLADSTVPGSDWGTVDGIGDEILEAARTAPGGVLIGIHHQPMPFDFPVYLPPGITRSKWQPFVSALGEATSRALVTTGHTHRHRRRRDGRVTVTEVGSTKDFPGTWAAYDIYEGGMIQMVHRIEEPSCIRWTDHTRQAAAGVWQLWSPGRLGDRCFTLVYPPG